MLELKRICAEWKELDSVLALAEINQETYPSLIFLIKDEIANLKARVIKETDGAIFSLKILEKIIDAYKNHQCYPMKKEGETVGIIYTNWGAVDELASAYKAEGTNIINVNNNCDFKFYVDKFYTEDSTREEKEKVEEIKSEDYYIYELDPDQFYTIKAKEEDYPYAETAFNEVFPEDVRAYIEEEWEMQWNLADGRNFLISNILSNPDVYNCLKGNIKKQQDLINIISSWWDSLIIFIEGYLEGCDKYNVDALTKIITASVDEPFENGRIKEDKLDEVISVVFDAMLEGNQNSEFKMFLGQPEIKNEFCNMVRDMALKMEAGASYEQIMAEALPGVVELMMKKEV